jgi:hypothetical protein
MLGKTFKAPFGGRGATLEISPAQRAGDWCSNIEIVLKGQGKSGVPSGRMNSLGARPDTGVSG